jgi:hypothetical protein
VNENPEEKSWHVCDEGHDAEYVADSIHSEGRFSETSEMLWRNGSWSRTPSVLSFANIRVRAN